MSFIFATRNTYSSLRQIAVKFRARFLKRVSEFDPSELVADPL